ncbi:hypothetical protein B0T17DRAFT_495243 [Bombardia bombarda]|uniref:Glycosyltransferase family 28 N-terminal domain-containing protein n=1 Tax=Bombardia bombarda TaxID=252184 RepID=A0AA39WMB8_9PEZI|nr:hypothetical protein B0T17DRAFT_495243 [Bombardia bombarda]
MPDLGANEDAPPAYGDLHDQIQFSQAGFNAGAEVTDDGRVNINISQKNSRLAELLAPTFRNQLLPEVKLPQGPLPPAYIPPSLGGQPGQTPPPRLNVVIQIVGSRGDVQPFIALGQVLRDTYGHRVRVATHATFQKFVEENGLEFFAIGGDPAELMAFMVKNPGLMPGIDALKSGEIKKRRQGIEEILLGCWRSCIEAGNGLGPPPRQHRPDEPVDERAFVLPAGNTHDRPFVADAIIANPPSFAHIHIAEKLGIPLHIMFTMPWSPTRAFAHPLANIESTNTDVVMTNYVSYTLVEMMTWQGLGDVINRFRIKVLDLEPLSLIWAPGLLNRLRIPTTYCWSPALIPKPADWASEITIAGFFFLNLASSYTPEPDLAAFLAAGPPPVYIGFGSIVVDDPNALTRMIFEAVSITGVRALVSKGWGGIGADSVGLPDGVFMLGNCPHDWLFKHVSAVVHHGGAGTSAAGIKLGKPTVVVPFFGDQPFWGAMIAKAGAGPAPIPYKKMTAQNLAAAIQEALKPETQTRAQELGASIREEQGADVGGKSFHEFLNTDSMRCSLAPSRVAVWRVRRAKTRLSALAGAVLVKQGVLKYSDLKLYRPTEHNTEDQPWDPISACTSALVGDIGNMAMAVGDFPRELFGAGKKKRTPTGGTDSPAPETPSAKDGAPSSILSLGTQSTAAGQSSTSLQSTTGSTLERSSTSTSASARPPVQQTNSQSRGQGAPPPPTPINMETAIGAGKGVSRVVETGMKMPMNFCLGLARGFRNAPKLYNDDTVRPTEKVTDFASGLKMAGKEFGLGFFDGVSGLVTQPVRGAEKEGAAGLLKGIGKGIGGLVLKPAAGIWSIPAYTMQGVHAEVRNLFSRSSTNDIITARALQGKEDLESSTVEEQKDILMRWQARNGELKGFYNLKQKEAEQQQQQQQQPVPAERSTSFASSKDFGDDPPPKTGWIHTRNMSIDERRKLHEQKDEWKKRQDARAANQPSPASVVMPSGPTGMPPSALEDEQFEQAIRVSVQQTSRGDREEDALIEANIRASVKEMRRIAELEKEREQQQQQQQQQFGRGDWKGALPPPPPLLPRSSSSTSVQPTVLDPGNDLEDMSNVSDEEYQALIAEAVKRSLIQKQQQSGVAAGEYGASAPTGGSATNVDEDEEQLRRAMEESERAHRDEQQRQRTEEDVVMEYVMRQSLAEEEYRRKSREAAVAGKEKGKGVGTEGDEEEVDEDLRRALEESMKVGGGRGGDAAHGAGPSGR